MGDRIDPNSPVDTTEGAANWLCSIWQGLAREVVVRVKNIKE